MSRPLRLLPDTYRARSALAIVLAVLLVAVVVLILNGVVDRRARDEVEATLGRQADAVALNLVRAGPEGAPAVLTDAAALLSDTRILVRVDGIDQYWSRPSGATYARATATRDWATVTLERVDPVSNVNDGLVVVVVGVGLLSIAGIAWLVSAGLSRRLVRSLRALSDTADEVADGRLEVRAQESPDEVGRLAGAFNRMTAQLAAAETRQREFLADVAHELRTPVTAIEGFAAALEDGTARTEEDRREAAGFIRQEAARMRELVRDLQELTWIDLDPPLDEQHVDLAEIAREAVARVAARAASRGVEVTSSAGPVPAVTDPAHVATILDNLISNALRATPSGGRVTVSVGADGGAAFLAVADTGGGRRREQ